VIALRDPWRRSMALATALVVAGFIAIVIAWVGVAATRVIPTQVAFAVSGGMGGFALVGTGIALFEIQRRRHSAAEQRRDFAAFASELQDLAELIAARRGG
jgi:uncharacterized membrane protein YdfJ with MMPL/SSD domain